MIVFGIKNCDTVKKARRWLESQGIDYRFHDLRSDGLQRQQLQQWLDKVSWEQLLNKRGTTWRQLDPAVKDSINAESAIELMLQQPTLIKRPVIEADNSLCIGFNETEYQDRYGH